MGDTHDNEGLFLPESILMRFAPEDEGWVGDLPALPDEAIAEIRTVLKTRLTPSQSNQVELQLMRDFGTAVEMAKVEGLLRQAANQERAGSKKKSAKLGVRLRTNLGKLRAEFEGDAVPDENGICARILEDPVLERLVTPFIEERTGGKLVDPLRNAPSVAFRHLRQILDLLFDVVDRGVATGRAEPALNFLAECVVRAVFRATGKIPGRTAVAAAWAQTTRNIPVHRLCDDMIAAESRTLIRTVGPSRAFIAGSPSGDRFP